jgi:hypothetical protein
MVENGPRSGREILEPRPDREESVPLGFHHHVATAVETEQDLDLLMTNTGEAVGLLFDAGQHCRRLRQDRQSNTSRRTSRRDRARCQTPRWLMMDVRLM